MSYQSLNLVIQIRLLGVPPNTPTQYITLRNLEIIIICNLDFFENGDIIQDIVKISEYNMKRKEVLICKKK